MIDFNCVTKRYGSTTAVDGLSMNVSDNGIYCLLGKNGAGKTTLMKLLAGHINAGSGSIVVDGKKISTGSQPECVNFMQSNSEQFNIRVSELIESAITPLPEHLHCIGQSVAGSIMAAYLYDERIEPPRGVMLDRVSLRDFFVKLVGGTSRHA
jgi:ABC-type cobalamin/Fe3+-siderophores transport system ATPase subunit